MSSGGHPPYQLAASFIHRAVATDQRAPIQLQSHLLPCRQGQRCRLRFVATGPLQAGQRRALVAFETGPEIWFRAARGMAQKKRPQSATTGAAAYTRQHRGMDWQAHGQGPARGIVPSPVNLGMLCADRSPPGDCIVRTHPSAASIIQLGGVVLLVVSFQNASDPFTSGMAKGASTKRLRDPEPISPSRLSIKGDADERVPSLKKPEVEPRERQAGPLGCPPETADRSFPLGGTNRWRRKED